MQFSHGLADRTRQQPHRRTKIMCCTAVQRKWNFRANFHGNSSGYFNISFPPLNVKYSSNSSLPKAHALLPFWSEVSKPDGTLLNSICKTALAKSCMASLISDGDTFKSLVTKQIAERNCRNGSMRMKRRVTAFLSRTRLTCKVQRLGKKIIFLIFYPQN